MQFYSNHQFILKVEMLWTDGWVTNGMALPQHRALCPLWIQTVWDHEDHFGHSLSICLVTQRLLSHMARLVFRFRIPLHTPSCLHHRVTDQKPLEWRESVKKWNTAHWLCMMVQLWLSLTCYRVKSFSIIVNSQSGKSAADVSKRPLLSPCMDILKEGKRGWRTVTHKLFSRFDM